MTSKYLCHEVCIKLATRSVDRVTKIFVQTLNQGVGHIQETCCGVVDKQNSSRCLRMYFEAATGNMLMPVLTFECGAVRWRSLPWAQQQQWGSTIVTSIFTEFSLFKASTRIFDNHNTHLQNSFAASFSISVRDTVFKRPFICNGVLIDFQV